MSGKKGMTSDKAWLVPRRYKGGFLDDLDGRSPAVRGVKYVRGCLESDLGGNSNISRMEYGLVDRSAFLIYLAEEMELAVLSGKKINVTEYLAVVNALSGLLSKIGLEEAPLPLVSGKTMLEGYSLEEARALKGKLHHAMERLGYEVFPNPKRKDRRWKAFGVLHTLYRLRGYEPKEGWEKERQGIFL